MIIIEGIGTTALKGIPVLKYGKLFSVERREIEGYRNIHNLFEKYLFDEREKKPLSVCVFGPPGSGKSFGIEEIIKYFEKREQSIKTQLIKFNLSQFSPYDLPSAFNQIRDISLNNKLPIVFWDEYDCEVNSQKLGWLKSFLAPMQDGVYYENANRHLIGRAIFVFAGGVYRNLEEMEKDAKNNKDCKQPDFLGRIGRKSLQLLGINQENNESGYKARRAVMIRKLIENHLDIDENEGIPKHIQEHLIKLFDRKEPYEHGIRSLESEIKKLLAYNNQ